MLQYLIIIFGIVFLIYKLVTHKGKFTLTRITALGSLIIEGGIVVLFYESVTGLVLFF